MISPNHVAGSKDAMPLLERALFGDQFGPGYETGLMTLRIGGVLMNTLYDDLEGLSGVYAVA
jgi:hypothetical protein